MKKKFGVLVTSATMSVLVAGCHSGGDPTLDQTEIRDYCGIDMNKLSDDLKSSDERISDVEMANTDCDVHVKYRTEDGEEREELISNDLLMGMIAGGGAAMLASYLMSNDTDRQGMVSQVKNKKRGMNDSAFLPMYLMGANSRAYHAYSSGNKASTINVSNGQVTTRSNAFRGVSSVARSASYSGG